MVPCAATAQSPDTGSCAAARATQRRTWKALDAPRAQPKTTEGDRVRHWPTATLGRWLVEIDGAERAELTMVSPTDVIRHVWNAQCAVTITRHVRAPADPPRFDDDALVERLSRTPRGVIYVWSPHMPLSVDAIPALTAAAAAQGLAVDLVLDPAADRAFAARVAAAHALPAPSLRVADAIELSFRDVLVHAPTAIVYAFGAFAGDAYPGGHTADEYTAYFTRVLAGRR